MKVYVGLDSVSVLLREFLQMVDGWGLLLGWVRPLPVEIHLQQHPNDESGLVPQWQSENCLSSNSTF